MWRTRRTYLDVEAAVGRKKVIDAFCDALLEIGDLVRLLGRKVKLVVYRNRQALSVEEVR